MDALSNTSAERLQYMSRTQHMIFWSLGALALGIVLHLLSDILLPFVLGMAVAYFLDPVADKLEEKGLSRLLATLIISICFFALVVLGLMLLVPVLQNQVIAIAARIPALVQLVEEQIYSLRVYIEGVLPPDAMSQAGSAAKSISSPLIGWAKTFVTKILSGGSRLFALLSLLVVTPIVSFYMLLEWDNIVARLNHLLPRKHAPTIRAQLMLMDQTISGFVRGQATVCLILGVYYAIALSVVGLEAGLLIGVGAGLISFVPYIGAMTGIAVGVGVGIAQFGAVGPVLIIAGVFLLGQFMESYVLTPRLVGNRVGLHDLWIIFALMAGGTLFGFTGVLLAVPVAAIIGVLIRFSAGCYLESALYTGERNDDT